MKVFRGLPNAESRAPCALTIGNFDGVLSKAEKASNKMMMVCVSGCKGRRLVLDL